ncbi:hypothetical protein N7532_000324 [Penicillium argentinense]|uniref:Uncharacterized protein n=1 Tax=Penicillium argentinense TaxID=1131581 RepID=A0A9W9G5B0_9EURO|nr:uncharacterized protein N7532_000324 [Penicillium argentinense]KAJ5112279.1 hypothetical protein N7532_000324 [Penicillium argentinense]
MSYRRRKMAISELWLSLTSENNIYVVHPGSESPLNTQTSKGFLKWYAVNTHGRIEEKPTVEAL